MQGPSPSPPPSAPRRFTLDFVPPLRFASVEEGLYRGAYPVLRNFPFLKYSGIRTILSITPEPATYDLKTFCKAENIELKYVQADRHKGEPQLLPTDLNEALNVLVQADNYPIYVHCLDGRHVVGLVIMALRKLQCWDYSAMQMEFERFTKEGNNETAYIMDYTGGLTLPPRVPLWLLHSPQLFDSDGRARRHPTLKIKHVPVAPTPLTSGPPQPGAPSVAVSQPDVNSGLTMPLPDSRLALVKLPSQGHASAVAAVNSAPMAYFDMAGVAPRLVAPGASVVAVTATTSLIADPSTPKKERANGNAASTNGFFVVPSPELQMLSVRSALCQVECSASSNVNAWENTTNSALLASTAATGGPKELSLASMVAAGGKPQEAANISSAITSTSASTSTATAGSASGGATATVPDVSSAASSNAASAAASTGTAKRMKRSSSF